MRAACAVVGLARSRYAPPTGRTSPPADTTLLEHLRAVVVRHPGWGFWKYYYRLRKDGVMVNHKRLWRLYHGHGLQLAQRTKKRLPARVQEPLQVPDAPNRCWSLDFISDTLTDGWRFRVLNVLDDFNRQLLGQAVDFSLPAARVIRLLAQLVAAYGFPLRLRSDNGPEFIAHALRVWCGQQEIRLQWIQPGKPTQNAFVERFHRSFRTEVLSAELFGSLADARQRCAAWQDDYNTLRPHQALNFLTPSEYLTAHAL